MADRPDKASSALSSGVNLLRGRIRPWVDGESKPDCLRGLGTAQGHGWILDTWDDEQARPLIILAAWILASGSTDDTNYVPLFVADSEAEIETLRAAATEAGIIFRRPRDDEADRAVEWKPREDASALGRVLHTWTGVGGDRQLNLMRFPTFPEYAPGWVARTVARTYVSLRGVQRPDKPERRVQIQEIEMTSSVDVLSRFWNASAVLTLCVATTDRFVDWPTPPSHCLSCLTPEWFSGRY